MPPIDNNAMPAQDAGDNPKKVLSKAENEELQNLYMQLAQAEKDYAKFLSDLGEEGVKAAISGMEDNEDRKALIDYYEHRPEEFDKSTSKMSTIKEISNWTSNTKQRIGQIEDESLKKLRTNPEARAVIQEEDGIAIYYTRSKSKWF